MHPATALRTAAPRTARRHLRLHLVLIAITAMAVTGCGSAGVPRSAASPPGEAEGRLKVLFLGDGGEHRAVERLRDVGTPLLNRGIELFYSEDPDELRPDRLRRFDAVLLYGDGQAVSDAERVEALVRFVEEGGGLVALHAAAGSPAGSARLRALIGGGSGGHRAESGPGRVVEPDHGIVRGFESLGPGEEALLSIEPVDGDLRVLEERGGRPHTWVRSQGAGRVFYSGWGHDEVSWTNAGFPGLLERAIRWTAGRDLRNELAEGSGEDPFRYAVLDVPFPPPHRVRMEYERTVGPMDRGSNYPLFHHMQLPMSPEESMSRMIVPPGFRVELFAAEPDIVNPIAMSWDERGRLWVVESVEYPYTRELWPDGGGKDRIVVLEDSDGDGRADRVTEFADGLHIPTGLTFADGGVIVHQAPQTLFLKDTTGDGRADVREVLFEGWSQRDTHAGPSNLHYGLDNWIWGVLGYSGFEGEVGGEPHSFGMGVYRFRKDGSRLEFLRRTNNNTWGLGFDEAGGAFVSTANGNPSTFLQLPRKRYDLLPELAESVTESLAESARFIVLSNEFRQVDWVGAYTAGAGHAVYTARVYPPEYWNRIAFVTEATGHLVGEFVLEERGSSYHARHPRNLIASDDQWFSPVVAEVGPDGNVWIADWYNYVIQHNAESDRQRPSPGNAYANPLRDRRHGRIYRIVHDGHPAADRFTLEGAGARQLVDALSHDNRFWRIHAQRLLVERGQRDVVPELLGLVRDPTVDELGLNVGAIHALWTLHGLGALDGSDETVLSAAVAALEHPSSAVRRNAVQVLPHSPVAVARILSAGLLEDEDAKVRVAALVALAEMPATSDAGRAVYAALTRPENLVDRWIREAGALAGTMHDEGFLMASADAGLLTTVLAGAPEPPNLAPQPAVSGDRATASTAGWSPRTRSGEAELTVVRGEGRSGGPALKIFSASGADASWVGPPIALKANTRYQLGGWVRTRNLERGGGRGAQLNLDGPPSSLSRTNALEGTTDWSFLERIITAPAAGAAALELRVGEGGGARGEVWFDGLVLRELGPEPGSTLESIVAMIAERTSIDVAGAVVAPGAPSRAGEGELVLEIGVVPDVLRFDVEEVRTTAGQAVRIVFTNTDNMEHNLVIVRPGRLETVGQLADQMMLAPSAREMHFVPDSPDVLFSTPALEPGARYELTFTAPSQPGIYPFVCTIPGHWRVMNGIIIVEPRE